MSNVIEYAACSMVSEMDEWDEWNLMRATQLLCKGIWDQADTLLKSRAEGNKIFYFVSEHQLNMCMQEALSSLASWTWNIKTDGHSSSIKESSMNKHHWVNIYSVFQ